MDEGRYLTLLGNHYETQALLYLLFALSAGETGYKVVCFMLLLWALITFASGVEKQMRGRELIRTAVRKRGRGD